MSEPFGRTRAEVRRDIRTIDNTTGAPIPTSGIKDMRAKEMPGSLGGAPRRSKGKSPHAHRKVHSIGQPLRVRRVKK